MEKKRIKVSIRFKGIILILVFALFIVAIAMSYYAIIITNRNKKTYKAVADSFSSSLTQVVDVNDFVALKGKVDHYFKDLTEYPDKESSSEQITKYYADCLEIRESDEYLRLRPFLLGLAESNKSTNVDCAYLGYVSKVANKDVIVYLVDSDQTENAVYPGYVEEITKVNQKVVSDPDRGFPAFEIKSSYGHLITSGSPLYEPGKKGIEPPVGYCFVDIQMSKVRADQAKSITRLFIYLLVTISLIAVIGVFIVHFVFVKHLNKLKKVATSYNSDHPEETHRSFINLKINTHDEIYDLAESIKKMESDINSRFVQLSEMNKELLASKKHAEEMSILANKDALTGVKNKIAYDSEVKAINKAIAAHEKISFGIAMVDLNYLKNTNDEFGHDVGDKALIKLTNLICDTFKRSPVYRTGGDEFIIILRGNDLNNIDELLEQFNKGLDESIRKFNLPDDERISAAIGFAKFNKKIDRTVDDVFKRADTAMYERKREMKTK